MSFYFETDLPWEEKRDEAATLNPTPCTACHLAKSAKSCGVGFSWIHKPELATGSTPPNPILFVGEGPGPVEDRMGKPFVGPSGQFLWGQIEQAKIPKDLVVLSNVVQCIPWKDPLDPASTEVRAPTILEQALCSFRLLREISHLKPRLIVPLGATAARYFLELGVSEKLSRVQKKISTYRATLYTVAIGGRDYPVWPTYHPAGVLRNPQYEHLFQCDLQNVAAIVNGEYNKLPETRVPKTTKAAVAMIDEIIGTYDALPREKQLKFFFTCDLETTSLDPFDTGARVLGLSLSYQPGDAMYIPIDIHGIGEHVFVPEIEPEVVIEKLKELFARVPVGNQHWKFDLGWITQNLGITEVKTYRDPMTMAHLVYGEKRPKQNSIKDLGRDFLHYGGYDDELYAWLKEHNDGKIEFGKVPFEILAPYAGVDAEAALRVTHILEEQVYNLGLLFPQALTTAAIPAFTDIEMAGIGIDREVIESLGVTFLETIKEAYRDILNDVKVQAFLDDQDAKALEKNPKLIPWRNRLVQHEDEHYETLVKIIGFNPSSTPQVGSIVYDYYKITFSDDWATDGGKRSVKESVLKSIKAVREARDSDDPLAKFISRILTYRSSIKLKSNYVDSLQTYIRPDGTLKVHYHLTGTYTGRLSSSSFAVHTIPRKGRADIKRAFVSRWKNPRHETDWRGDNLSDFPYFSQTWMGPSYPKDGGGLIISADYSQLELRVLAAVSKDPGMIAAFESGQDLHRYVASRIFYPDLPKLGTVAKQRLDVIFEGFSHVEAFTRAVEAAGGRTEYEALISYMEQNPDAYERFRYDAITSPQRSLAKGVSFGLVYGASAKKIASGAKDMSEKEAMGFIDEYFKTFKSVKDWIELQHSIAKKRGLCSTPTGRIRWLFNARSKDRYIAEADMRKAQNGPIQGAASDICVMAIVLLRLELIKRGMKSVICGSIHDSILPDVYPGELMQLLPVVKDVMENQVVSQPGFKEWLPPLLRADMDLGVSWGGVVTIGSFSDHQLTLSGTPRDIEDVVVALKKAYRILETARELRETPDGEKLKVVLGVSDR